ncbi:MAG: hypothetical protein LPK88_09275 [Alphaproteobacteria bacterium]|nr:hypothetical protein [Alphaproteobacteria bacterium]MDX5416488.1 hypothetical protein [Alphaproteobacteria bacterium]MDX5493842.1 hypothetical protein [Alphaproteobacteria bacterium]
MKKQSAKAFRCPCCKFKTLGTLAQYEICPVCFWEDDGQNDDNAAAIMGGPNGSISLCTARDNYARFGAVDEKLLPYVRQPLPDEI